MNAWSFNPLSLAWPTFGDLTMWQTSDPQLNHKKHGGSWVGCPTSYSLLNLTVNIWLQTVLKITTHILRWKIYKKKGVFCSVCMCVCVVGGKIKHSSSSRRRRVGRMEEEGVTDLTSWSVFDIKTLAPDYPADFSPGQVFVVQLFTSVSGALNMC